MGYSRLHKTLYRCMLFVIDCDIEHLMEYFELMSDKKRREKEQGWLARSLAYERGAEELKKVIKKLEKESALTVLLKKKIKKRRKK